ncbi:MAG: hypothetical protein JOZ42_11105 [Acetobacteraceae bacterium]|nr:hypothetical protein [Acetobacteraceae bacterium]
MARRIRLSAIAVAAAVASAAPGLSAAETGSSDARPAHPPQAQQLTPPDGGGSRTGIIHPPGTVDPGMTKPAPNAQAFPTPVVPPPGTPGGNQQVIPK